MAGVDRSVRRVVVADDDYLVRMVVRAVLEDEGFEVIEAANGADAVAQTSECPPELVLIDAHMPGPSLSESLSALISSRDENGAPGIVVITGDAIRPIEADDESIGFLSKPVDLKVLLETVARYAVQAVATRITPDEE